MAKALERLEAAEAAAADKLGYIRKTHTHRVTVITPELARSLAGKSHSFFFLLFVLHPNQPWYRWEHDAHCRWRRQW